MAQTASFFFLPGAEPRPFMDAPPKPAVDDPDRPPRSAATETTVEPLLTALTEMLDGHANALVAIGVPRRRVAEAIRTAALHAEEGWWRELIDELRQAPHNRSAADALR
jgi:hypothetical protein